MDTGNQWVEEIQSSGFKAHMAVTGGGSGAVHALLSHPGASRFVQDVQIPYSAEALEGFLGEKSASACSEETARKMARVALNHASSITPHALGIACTAALQTNRERKGADRAYICFQTLETEFFHCLEIPMGSRVEQETMLSAKLLYLLVEFIRQNRLDP